MTRQRYPLNGLRTFEAAARHLSFVKAAEELHVTPAAVSHQIKGLEEFLGVRLFRRLTRGLLLTEAGQSALPQLKDGFDRLDGAIELLRKNDRGGALTISVGPAFASKWLVPRLEQFGVSHPEIDLRISSSLAVVDFRRESFDAAIRFGGGRYPDLTSIELFEEWVAPMCSQRLVEGDRSLRAPEDLKNYILLHDDSIGFEPTAPTWKSWLEAAGVEGIDPRRGPRFSHPDHALQAAIDGAGVVLGWRCLAASDLAAGRLIEPLELALPMGLGFHFVCPPSNSKHSNVDIFRDWLLDEIGQSTQMSAGLKNGI